MRMAPSPEFLKDVRLGTKSDNQLDFRKSKLAGCGNSLILLISYSLSKQRCGISLRVS